jgi:hypothetical protein
MGNASRSLSFAPLRSILQCAGHSAEVLHTWSQLTTSGNWEWIDGTISLRAAPTTGWVLQNTKTNCVEFDKNKCISRLHYVIKKDDAACGVSFHVGRTSTTTYASRLKMGISRNISFQSISIRGNYYFRLDMNLNVPTRSCLHGTDFYDIRYWFFLPKTDGGGKL